MVKVLACQAKERGFEPPHMLALSWLTFLQLLFAGVPKTLLLGTSEPSPKGNSPPPAGERGTVLGKLSAQLRRELQVFPEGQREQNPFLSLEGT